MRNRDTHHSYRFDSYFYYLTGFREPEAVLVLVAGDAVVTGIEPITVSIRADAANGIDPEDWQRLLAALRTARSNLLAVRCEALSGEGAAAWKP